MTIKNEMNKKRINFGITYDDKKKEVYVFGGKSGGYLNNCEKYSIDKDVWTELKPMINKKHCSSACIFNNQFIYVIGGKGANGCLNEIDRYSIQLN